MTSFSAAAIGRTSSDTIAQPDVRPGGGHISRIPAERLYWSVFEVPAGTRIRPGLLPLGLQQAFEEDVPLAGLGVQQPDPSAVEERLHIVCAPLGPGRLVACGAPVEALRSAAGAADTLLPAGLPPFILAEMDIDAGEPDLRSANATVLPVLAQLNLLIGEFEPRAQKARRARRRSLLLVTALLCMTLLAIGMERRIRASELFQTRVTSATEQELRSFGRAIGSAGRISIEALPAAVAVAQRTTDAAARVPVPRDAAGVLADLLRVWPMRSPDGAWACSIQSLGITGDTITASVTIEGHAAGFLRALAAPPTWTIDEPRLTALGAAQANRRVVPSSGASAPLSEPTTPAHTLTRIAITMRPAPMRASP